MTAPDAGDIPPPGRAGLVHRMRERLGPVPEPDVEPLVSIVVVTRDGLGHLRRLLRGLRRYTGYPRLELVVFDNGSSDGSVEFLRTAETPFPISVVEHDGNLPFSDANNAAVDRTQGELLLFLNNDVEPFDPGWLTELVACRERTGAAAVGSILLHGSRSPAPDEPAYVVQHRGIRFYREGGLVRAVNLGEGEDLFDRALGEDSPCPAVTAACLLIERETFDAVGGFTTGYRYGTEDVDLGLKLVEAGGFSVCCGRSVLFHHESSTQRSVARAITRENRLGNRRLLHERYGPQLERDYRMDRLAGGGFWSEAAPRHLGITVSSNDVEDGFGDWYTARELGEALEREGWRVSYLQRRGDEWYSPPRGIDYILVLLDAYDVRKAGGIPTIAWIRNWTERWLERQWFERFDVVLASSRRSAEMVSRATGRHVEVWPLATNPDRFRPLPPEPVRRTPFVFTGNHWKVRRPIQDALAALPRGQDYHVYGRGWEDDADLAPHWRGAADYEDLPSIYSSADLVVDDTAPHALPYDALNSRVFDALACGAVVVTNCEQGAGELFDGAFPTWDSPESLRAQLDRYGADRELREQTARRYRDIVLRHHTYEHRARGLEELLKTRARALSFVIKIGAPDWARAPAWGDLYFARALRRQLEAGGHRCAIQVLEEWIALDGLRHDVVVHLKGLSEYSPRPGQLNVLWCISHPDRVTPEECDRYDLVFVASERFAASLAGRTRTPVRVLEQAADPDIFFPQHDPEQAHELVFVGNSRRVMRRILEDLLPTERDLAVWGGDWDGLIDPRHVRGLHVPNEEVGRIYSSAGIVLNDHWDDMREQGFVSNRIYDALAAGALVITDHLPEIAERFGDTVVTYRTREELGALVDHYLEHPGEREERARRGREIVLAQHTFAHRADDLLRAVRERIEELDFPLRIAPAAAAVT